MLLVLTDSLKNALNQDVVLEALENIALGRREGKHLIFANYNTLESLKNCSSLSKRTRQVYLKLYAQLHELPHPQSFVRCVEVVALDAGLSSRMEGHCKVISIPARYFCDSALIQETQFMTENLDDATFYQTIAEIYLKWKKLKNKIKILLDQYPGGGSTTVTAYKLIQDKQKRFCLCLLDSDKKSSSSPLGDTAKNVVAIDDPNKPFCECFVIGVREIENLIPTRLYSEISSGDPNRIKCVSFLEQLEKSTFTEARKYLDIKKGLKLGEILSASNNTPFSKDWMNWLDNIRPLAISISKTCINNQVCIKGENCGCIITTGLGDNILKTVIERIEKPTQYQLTEHKIAEMVDQLLKPEWEEIGEIMMAWCCGTRKMIQ